MKKKNLLISSIVLMMLSITACGKEEPAASAAETETDMVIHLEGEIQGIQLGGGSEQESEMEETEPENSNDKKFECLPEIQEASIDSGKFQIDDMVFTIGAPVQEIFDALENSECEYEYDYTPNTLIERGQGVTTKLTFRKNGKDYMEFCVYNYENKTCDLKDCTLIYAYVIGMDIENAYYAGNISVGDSYEDILEKLKNNEIINEESDSLKQEYTIKCKVFYETDERPDAYGKHSLGLTFDSNTKILKRWFIWSI